ncbi:cation transporter [Sporomusa malonica]|uniref:Copper chaperone CopZ n=1 Tax=Sporomusa malonica TaxID=112901 RepID=A0A1W2EN24_9FIRM|nr:cation transporter [Sporomusa malonica]SMD10558.1 copper chaperone [Sporomusa malonica]
MEKHIITVEGMSCGHCKNAVEKAVLALSGVAAAEVNLAAKTLTIEIDEAKIGLTQIKETIEEQGFTAL